MAINLARNELSSELQHVEPPHVPNPEVFSGANSHSPVEEKIQPRPHVPTFHPLSPEVLILLMPAAVFGTLARLGLFALTTYPGESIFPLAYVQGVGCLIMGFCLELKEPISN
jgi:fluoride exporter